VFCILFPVLYTILSSLIIDSYPPTHPPTPTCSDGHAVKDLVDVHPYLEGEGENGRKANERVGYRPHTDPYSESE
jgi:hypothetical protein